MAEILHLFVLICLAQPSQPARTSASHPAPKSASSLFSVYTLLRQYQAMSASCTGAIAQLFFLAICFVCLFVLLATPDCLHVTKNKPVRFGMIGIDIHLHFDQMKVNIKTFKQIT